MKNTLRITAIGLIALPELLLANPRGEHANNGSFTYSNDGSILIKAEISASASAGILDIMTYPPQFNNYSKKVKDKLDEFTLLNENGGSASAEKTISCSASSPADSCANASASTIVSGSIDVVADKSAIRIDSTCRYTFIGDASIDPECCDSATGLSTAATIGGDGDLRTIETFSPVARVYFSLSANQTCPISASISCPAGNSGSFYGNCSIKLLREVAYIPEDLHEPVGYSYYPLFSQILHVSNFLETDDITDSWNYNAPLSEGNYLMEVSLIKHGSASKTTLCESTDLEVTGTIKANVTLSGGQVITIREGVAH